MKHLCRPWVLFAVALLGGCARGPVPSAPGPDNAGRTPKASPAPPSLLVREDLARARREARVSGKPLLVLSVLGDYRRHC